MKRNKKPEVFAAVRAAAASHKLLALGTVLRPASVLASLPPLLLARIIDGLTGGMPLAFTAALMVFRQSGAGRRAVVGAGNPA